MSRFAALVLAGFGTADLLLIDFALAPLVLNPVSAHEARATLQASDAERHSSESEQATRPRSTSSSRAADALGAPLAARDAQHPATPSPESTSARPGGEKQAHRGQALNTSAPASGRVKRRRYHLEFPVAGQDWVPKAAKAPLQKIAQRVQSSGAYRVIVRGHTDARGSRGDNQQLALQRAKVIASHLVSLGVQPELIETHAFGEDRPAIKGWNRYAWSKNRRVEVVLEPLSRNPTP